MSVIRLKMAMYYNINYVTGLCKDGGMGRGCGSRSADKILTPIEGRSILYAIQGQRQAERISA